MSSVTPNMNLIESTVNVDTGLQWENNLNASLTLIDQHNHSAGNGVLITPNGLNINSDLPMAGNNLTLARSVKFSVQPSALALAGDIGCLYVTGADLYYNDTAGNQVRITSGGLVNATSSGISSGSASASFVASVLVINAASNTPADVKGGSFFFGNNSAASKYLKLSPPAAMGSNFNLILPNIPASTLPVTLDASGNFGTGQITTAQIANLSVTAALIANNTITATQIANNTISATQIVNATITQTQVATSFVTSGTYTPAASSASNITIVSIPDAQYFRVGRVVSVCGNMTIQNSGTGAFSFRLSIPIVSTFTDSIYAGGSFIPMDQTTTAVDIIGGMQTINGTNSVVLIKGVCDGSGGTYGMSYNFSYQVL